MFHLPPVVGWGWRGQAVGEGLSCPAVQVGGVRTWWWRCHCVGLVDSCPHRPGESLDGLTRVSLACVLAQTNPDPSCPLITAAPPVPLHGKSREALGALFPTPRRDPASLRVHTDISSGDLELVNPKAVGRAAGSAVVLEQEGGRAPKQDPGVCEQDHEVGVGRWSQPWRWVLTCLSCLKPPLAWTCGQRDGAGPLWWGSRTARSSSGFRRLLPCGVSRV